MLHRQVPMHLLEITRCRCRLSLDKLAMAGDTLQRHDAALGIDLAGARLTCPYG
jgi:hypothetical protein